jgi:hypothetical protein
VQTALQALPSIGSGNVSVTGPNGGPYVVTFTGALAMQSVSSISGSGAGLTPGGTATAVQVANTVNGVGPNTSTDNQIVKVKLGEAYDWPFPTNASFEIWARHNGNDASPTGVRALIQPADPILGGTQVKLSRFNAGVETVMGPLAGIFTNLMLAWAPVWFESWELIAGSATNAREFKVLRGGVTVLDYTETGTGSVIGSGNRGSAWGITASAGATSQGVPPGIEEFDVADNATVTQSGTVKLTNFGDQPGPPRFLVYGPGTFNISNGPGGSMISFGPLGDGQMALLTTQSNKRGVVDLSPQQPAQPLDGFQTFIDQLVKFAVNGNVPPLLQEFESLFGIPPPQGEMYHLLNGRFTQASSIPPKPTNGPPKPVDINVQIVNGNPHSRIVAALTPLRRWPE